MPAKGKFDFKFKTLPTTSRSEWIVLPQPPNSYISVLQHWLPDDTGKKKECFACPQNWGDQCALCDFAQRTGREDVQRLFALAERVYVYALAIDGDYVERSVLTMTEVAWRAFGPLLEDGRAVAEQLAIMVRPAKNEAGGIWWNAALGEPVELEEVPAAIDLWKTVRQTTYADSMDRLVEQAERSCARTTPAHTGQLQETR